jgi:transcriptional regulator with XRE-family HTH domain
MARSQTHEVFGRAVRQARERTGLTQEELGHRAGMHRTYVAGIERGERNFSFANLLRLAEALRTEPSELLRSAEELERRGNA